MSFRMNNKNMSALFTAYNLAKAWARRTGLSKANRVNSALGYLMSGEAELKWDEYKTRGAGRNWTCECPDHQIRGIYCKHILSLIIAKKHDEIMADFLRQPTKAEAGMKQAADRVHEMANEFRRQDAEAAA